MPVSFRRIRISGFKSFAEPTNVEILPGLTGIVGPNGCGKSNVVEALRWAMGESSARSLRGGEMDDVIFAGTAARASRNIAEVTLHLDDAQGAAPPPFHEAPELEISRRIERGSGSATPPRSTCSGPNSPNRNCCPFTPAPIPEPRRPGAATVGRSFWIRPPGPGLAAARPRVSALRPAS